MSDIPYWSFEEGNKPPEKLILFDPPNEDGFSYTWNMEDFLQGNWVFLAGFGKERRKSNCDSYGTIVDFVALDVAYKLLEEQYHPTEQDWSGLLKTWSEGVNSQIPLKLVAITIRHKLTDKLLKEVVDTAKTI